jgi:GNAT acetyltransferase-like protein
MIKAAFRKKRAISRGELRLAVRPWEEGREAWDRLISVASGVNLYHRVRWIETLRRSYGLRLYLAIAESDRGEPMAACVFARSKNPFAPRLVSLPFSDSCPPLAVDPDASRQLVGWLAAHKLARGGYEIRGLGAPAPWAVADCFCNWILDVSRPLATIERGLSSSCRRKIRSAQNGGVEIDRATGLPAIRRFYILMAEARRRQGVPVQPLRFFELLHQLFDDGKDVELCFASQRGRDVACDFILRDGDWLYYKWGARRTESPFGATQLLMWSVIQEHAGKSRFFDLGRTDKRNAGLNQFKRELGAVAHPVPYAFFPEAPSRISAEVLSPRDRVLAAIWSRLPLPATRVLSSALYGYLA